MWETHRIILDAYKDCYRALNESIVNKEEVDIGGSCVGETEALVQHTLKYIENYKAGHP